MEQTMDKAREKALLTKQIDYLRAKGFTKWQFSQIVTVDDILDELTSHLGKDEKLECTYRDGYWSVMYQMSLEGLKNNFLENSDKKLLLAAYKVLVASVEYWKEDESDDN